MAGNELLAAKSRIDRHHQHQIDLIEDRLYHLGRRTGINRHAYPHVVRAHQLDRSVKMRSGFGVDRNDVRAGARECWNICVDRRDHQMHIER